jgi:CRP-like cAMP-binding protein
MFEKVKESFSQFTFLTPADLLDLAFIFKLKHVKKGDHLVRAGEYNYQALKVITGLLCHYIIDERGVEKTLLFVPEKMHSGSMQTTMMGKPADENIIALENTLLLSADMRELDRLASSNIRILKMVHHSYKQIIVEAAERVKFLVAHTPEQRYLHFCKTYPHLEQRVKQKDLASYLVITVTSLSRIRARISKS